MKINREEIEPGKWEYADEDEGWFIFWVKPDYDVESMDNFIEGRQKVIRRDAHGNRVEVENVVLGEEVIEHLLEIRGEALAAYRARDVPLMLAKLGQLEAQCNWRGLAFAARPEVELATKTRRSKSRSGSSSRSVHVDGECLAPLAIIDRLATQTDELGWLPPSALWEPFKAAIEEQGFCVTETVTRKGITRRGKPSLVDEKSIEIRVGGAGKGKTYSYAQFCENLREARKKLKT